MKKAAVCFSAFAAAAAFSASASAADVCLQIDGAHDELSREERAQARSMLARVIESAGDHVSGQACSQTYLVTHRKTAAGIAIRIVGPRGAREASCANMSELERAYRQIMMPQGLPRAAPKRQAADQMLYARIGASAVPGDGLHGGPHLGIGLRLELDRVGVDASMNLGVTQTGPSMSVTGYRGSWLAVSTHYFLAPEADDSPYLGVGLSWGGRSEQICNRKYDGAGLQGELTAGWEFLRSSTIRVFVQADATMPLYLSRSGVSEPRYLPSMGLSLGVGWGRPRGVGVEKIR